MKTFQKVLLVVGVIIFTAQAQAVMYQMRPYEPNTAQWLTRDPIGEEGGLNLYGFAGNDAVNKFDDLGLACGCKCKHVKITFNPSTIFGNMKIGFYQSPKGERFGDKIQIDWVVDGDPTQCKYFVFEPPGGVTGTTPTGNSGASVGTGGVVQITQLPGYDAMGIPVSQPGRYTIHVDLIQTYSCQSDDGSWVTETRNYKKDASKKWNP